MSTFAIPLSKNCSFLSHLSKNSAPPAATSLSTARHRHLWRPSLAPLSATNFYMHTKPNDYLSAGISSEEIELHPGLDGEETSSNSEEEEEEEAEDFDAQELELEARQVVKEFSDSLSRQLKIGSFILPWPIIFEVFHS